MLFRNEYVFAVFIAQIYYWCVCVCISSNYFSNISGSSSKGGMTSIFGVLLHIQRLFFFPAPTALFLLPYLLHQIYFPFLFSLISLYSLSLTIVPHYTSSSIVFLRTPKLVNVCIIIYLHTHTHAHTNVICNRKLL